MKIIFDHQIFTQQIYGGISRYYCELAAALSVHEAQDVKIAASLHINDYLGASSELSSRNFKLPAAASALRISQKFIGLIDTVASRLSTRLSMPDVIHETFYSSHPIINRGSRRILTVYDMINEIFSDSFPTSDRTSVQKKIAVLRADHIICISERTQQDLIERFRVSPNRTSVVHLGISSLPSPTAPPPRNTIPYFLYVGSRFGYKNFTAFIRAFASSHSLTRDFRVICLGGGGFSESENDLFSRIGITPRHIEYTSGSDSVLAYLYRYASAFIYPSLYEGFGIPPLEAMSCGCPVACSNTGSIPEIVGQSAKFFDPYEVASIVSSLEAVVYNSSLRERLIRSGIHQSKLFTWKRCARETLAIYEAC